VKILSDIMLIKTMLRSALLAARNAIGADVRSQWDAAIGAHVVAWWKANPVQTLGVYWPIRSEPDLRATYADLASRGVRLALPIVAGKNAPLRFAAWTPGDALVQDSLGIAIPAADIIVQPQALLIPCVGFNTERIRLGYGGGFYDRTLALQPRPLAIGIGYACALAVFDGAPHDVALDMIITESADLVSDALQHIKQKD
jgi:5-formyltetrahydrofolate cyclo-ligase